MIDIVDLGNYLHLGDLSADDAAILSVELGNAVVREYCGWWMYPALTGEIITLDGDGSRALKLPTLCLNAVNSVTLDGVLLDPLTDYYWSGIGLVYRSQLWPCGARNVVVDCDHGYAVRPGGPSLVALATAAREYMNPERIIEASSGTVRRRYADPKSFSELETRLLDPHRLP